MQSSTHYLHIDIPSFPDYNSKTKSTITGINLYKSTKKKSFKIRMKISADLESDLIQSINEYISNFLHP